MLERSHIPRRSFYMIWPHQKLTVEARGVNATAVEKDIGTVNGVIHVIDTFLGIPSLTIAGKMEVDELMRWVVVQVLLLNNLQSWSWLPTQRMLEFLWLPNEQTLIVSLWRGFIVAVKFGQGNNKCSVSRILETTKWIYCSLYSPPNG